MLTPYLESVYRDGGRGEVVYGHRQYDCWGLTRAVRHEVHGLPLMASYGAISAANKRGLTRACARESQTLDVVPPADGAIVTVWKRGLCTHIAICVELDGRLGVLETCSATGPRWQPLAAFERQYLKVIYYS